MALVRPYVRPGFAMSRFINPIMVRLGITPVLVVRGRRSGALLEVPMGPPLELDGVRYLVSGRGETHWARNLRAAREGSLRVRGKTERFHAVELTGDERARIVEAYRAKLGRRVRGYFSEIPDVGDHPVFRIEPIA